VTSFLKRTTTTMLFGAALASTAAAAEILVTADISTSTTWTADNTYNLQNQIYVLSGASLTIEAGTIVASTPTANGSGSLAVARGGQIFIEGTAEEPVIMTSTADAATWTGTTFGPFVPGNPKTGIWREAANEWGNLTIMGNGFISEDAIGSNSMTCSASNVADMEGLSNGPSTDRYGGGDDDDDSGTISYLSVRYGGRVIGLANELNGLSLGGIGRGTDISYVEIMNNVDDGIEIWGGTVNLKYFTIWNIGDDSFDVDQGWRGKAQFGMIVQGYSLDTSQGGGVGDNCFETDGAENSDFQPVTTATLYNMTVIGNPDGGDGGTAWRDNARVQYRNCIFMDLGEELVRFDDSDGDGAQGYGHNGTLSWTDTWTTSYTATSTVNPCPNPGDRYTAQVDGNLCEITDSVFYNNAVDGDDNATLVGVLPANGTNNNVSAVSMPIASITRGPLVTKGGREVRPVIGLDPRAANDATSSVGSAPNDGFFTPAAYRGAFDSTTNWAKNWTAASAYGFYGFAASVATRNGGTNPAAYTANNLEIGADWTADVDLGVAGKATSAIFAFDTPFSLTLGPAGRVLLALDLGGAGELLSGGGVFPAVAGVPFSGTDEYLLPIPNVPQFCGLTLYSQAILVGPAPYAFSNAQDLTVGT